MLVASCAPYQYLKVHGERKTILDAGTKRPVADAEVEVLIYRLDKMAVEETRTFRSDAEGHVRIPQEEASGYVLPSTSLATAPRENSYWIRKDGYLPLHLGIWPIHEWLLTTPGEELLLYPRSAADALPGEVVFRTAFRERGDQSLFVPATRPDRPIAGALGIEILGVAAHRPLTDEFEKCGCRKAIEAKLDGARLVTSFDKLQGPFVDWPDRLAVHLAFADGSDVGAWLISQGLALVDFRFDHDRRAEYERLEDEAAQAGRGVWGPLKAIGAKKEKRR